MQHPKRRGRDDEHVDRHGADQVIVQKAAPSRGGTFRAPRKVPPTVPWLNLMPNSVELRRPRALPAR
jgi:hypothetical protein